MKNTHFSRKLIASAILVGAAAGGTATGTGLATADEPTAPHPKQAGQQPGMPTSTESSAAGESTTQPGMPTSTDAAPSSAPTDSGESTAPGATSQPGMPTSTDPAPTTDQSAPSAAPAADPAPEATTTPQADSGGSLQEGAAPAADEPVAAEPVAAEPVTEVGGQPSASEEDGTPVPEASTGQSGVVATPAAAVVDAEVDSEAPTDAQPGMPTTTPAETFEQKLAGKAPHLAVAAPPTGTSTPVAPQVVEVPGAEVTVAPDALPDVTYSHTQDQGDGEVSATGEGAVGPNLATSVSATAAADQVDTTGVVQVTDNKVGVSQSGQSTGGYQGSGATDGANSGTGEVAVTNSVNSGGDGSTVSGQGSWSPPAGGGSVEVSGTATFGNMQIPKVNGGVSVKTPWGNFSTPGVR